MIHNITKNILSSHSATIFFFWFTPQCPIPFGGRLIWSRPWCRGTSQGSNSGPWGKWRRRHLGSPFQTIRATPTGPIMLQFNIHIFLNIIQLGRTKTLTWDINYSSSKSRRKSVKFSESSIASSKDKGSFFLGLGCRFENKKKKY